MRLKTVTIVLVLVLAVAGGLAACSRASSGAGTAARPEPVTTLNVINQGALDMNIFVLRSPAGQRIRLGTATANLTTKMQIPAHLLFGANTSLRFIADPIGGRRASVSESILVTPGDRVTLQIPPY